MNESNKRLECISVELGLLSSRIGQVQEILQHFCDHKVTTTTLRQLADDGIAQLKPTRKQLDEIAEEIDAMAKTPN